MPPPAAPTRRTAPRLGWVEALIRGALHVACRVLPALPSGVVLALADLVGTVLWLLDASGRDVGRQNLDAVFGADLPARAKRRILRASYRNAVRVEALLFHLQPLPPARYARWVRFDPDDLARLEGYVARGARAVLVSAHLGNWELLLAARTALPFAPPFAYLAESANSRALDETLDRLRDRGSGGAAQRRRGALALRSALAQGKCVSLLMDRNLRGENGGAYIPFLGLPARTTPLGARLAQAFGVHLVGTLMLPDGPCRWRCVFSGDLMPPPSGDPVADVREALVRANAWLGDAIRRHPEAYLWTLKRFKSRPTAEPGRHPAYSFHDPA